MFSRFDEQAQKVLLMAKKEMLSLKHPYVGSEHLLLAILHNNELDITKYLNSCDITYDNYRMEIIKVIGEGSSSNNWFLYTPLLKRVIENAILDSKENNEEVSVLKLFISLLEEGDGVANRILMGMNIDIDLLYEKFSSAFKYKNRGHSTKLLIEEFSVDFNKMAKNGEIDPMIGCDDKINKIIEILLRKTKNNPLLIGEAGVGKTALVEELARRIEKGLVPDVLKNKRILSISMASLISGTKYRGEFEERISKMINEVEKDSSIILFIDEIHTIVGAGGAEGAIDASNILKPYLARGKLKLIGATTKREYSKYLEVDRALDRRFQKVYVEESTKEETEKILLSLKTIYENYHNILITDSIIKNIVELSDRYISFGKEPDKSIDILDAVCTKTVMLESDFDRKVRILNLNIAEIKEQKNLAIVNQDFKLASSLKDKEKNLESELNNLQLNSINNISRKKVVLDTLYDVIYDKTKIPISSIINIDRVKLSKKLKSSIIGQDKIVDRIIDICSFKNSNRKTPFSFLLVGKSGVGKTFLVKEYAKILYSRESFIRVDLSEYRDSSSINKIIGSNPGYVGYDNKSTVLDKVKDNPYSVILLDEIEKAHPSVMKLFLQVLDDGYMTSSNGDVIDFSNCIIFMTSNLGCDKNSIGFVDNKYTVVLEKIKSFLGVELVNRIDDVLLFNDITKRNMEKIIKKKLVEFSTCNNINIIDINKYVNQILIDSNYLEFGARRVDRLIDNMFKNMISV